MEKDILYIAGDPDAYPLEYYDPQTGSYQGVIPELMRRFSQQGRYDVRYYPLSGEDQRGPLAANRQVDILSCPEDIGAVPHRSGEDILLLRSTGDGQAAVLCLLDTAPEGLGEELRDFMAGVSQEELTGMVIQAARDGPPQSHALSHGVILALALAVLLLCAALVGVSVSNRRRLKRLRQDGELDPVTGIGNRRHLERYFQAYVHDETRILYTLYCFYYDPHAVPDGEEAGFARHMAAALQGCASDTDILARVSDSCFVLLRLSAGEGGSEEWLSAALSHIQKEAQAVYVTAGAYRLKADDRDIDEIVSRGLRAAQAAWRHRTGCQFFTEEAPPQEERKLLEDMEAGLQNREFQLYLHFYVDSRNGRVAGAEVQVQWEHPEKGLLPTALWRPLLEKKGLACRLDGYVLERACALLDFLRRHKREDFFLVYGLRSLAFGELERELREIGEKYKFAPRRLLLGIPQGAKPQEAAPFRSMGIGLVLEDFDGQLARLSQAGDAHFQGVKLNSELTGRVVLETLIQAGHKLGLAVLAEEVATKEQAGLLRELGCDLMRGELYARPLPLWEATEKLVGRLAGKEEKAL